MTFDEAWAIARGTMQADWSDCEFVAANQDNPDIMLDYKGLGWCVCAAEGNAWIPILGPIDGGIPLSQARAQQIALLMSAAFILAEDRYSERGDAHLPLISERRLMLSTEETDRIIKSGKLKRLDDLTTKSDQE